MSRLGSFGVLMSLTVGLLAAVTWTLVTASQDANERLDRGRSTLAVVQVQGPAVSVLNELMVERGWSEIMLAGGGSGPDLEEVRSSLDAALVDLREAWAAARSTLGTDGGFDAVVANTGLLDELRAALDRGSAQPGDTERGYSALTDDLVGAINDLNLTLTDGTSLRNRRAVAALIDAMTSLGEQRLLLGRAIAVGAPLPEREAVALEFIADDADRALRRYAQLVRAGRSGVEVPGAADAEMAALAETATLADELRSSTVTSRSGIGAGEWFIVATGEIDRLVDRAHGLDQLLTDAIERDMSGARRTRTLQMGGLGSLMVLSLLVGGGAVTATRQRQRAVDEYEALASGLNRWFLPSALPDVDGLVLAARYLPAADHAQAGGDWYDAFVVDDQLVCVVGDVAGHGPEAAADMARIRNTLLGAAAGVDPGSDIRRLESKLSGGVSMATLVSVVIDVARHEVRYCRAGHPPPLIRHADASVAILMDDGGPPIGVGLESPRTQYTHRFEPGSTLLLYTDGLIEEPGKIITESIGALAERFGEFGTALDLDALVASATDGPQRDDIAVLSVHYPCPVVGT